MENETKSTQNVQPNDEPNVELNNSDTVGQPIESEGNFQQDNNPSTSSSALKKSNKGVMIGIVAAVIVIIVVVCIAFSASRESNSESSSSNTYVSAKITKDGTAYIPLMNGEVISLNEDKVEDAVLTADKEHVIVLLKNGDMYVTDMNQEEKTQISNNVDSFSYVREDGFFYTDKNGIWYRVKFADYSVVTIGETVDVTVASDTLSILYVSSSNRHVCKMRYDEDEEKQIGSYKMGTTPYLNSISDDAEIAVWTETTGYSDNLYLCNGEDSMKLGEIERSSDYRYTRVNYTEDQELVMITDLDSDIMWILPPGEDVISVSLGANPAYSSCYTKNGVLSKEIISDVSSTYIGVSTDDARLCNVYNLSMSGERERILSNVRNFSFAGGYIAYIDDDHTLYYAPVEDKNLSEPTKISTDVGDFQFSDNGEYIYYMKDYDESSFTGTLYAFKPGDTEPIKISSDVYADSLDVYTDILIYLVLQNSMDGNEVYFYKDVTDIPDTYRQYGMLMRWNEKDDTVEKVASDVILNSLNSSLKYSAIDSNSFTYVMYNSVNNEQEVIGDWNYFNGSDSSRMAQDIIY